ncbi:unnamed protein product, partial [Symbiodinium microadriaticum]
ENWRLKQWTTGRCVPVMNRAPQFCLTATFSLVKSYYQKKGSFSSPCSVGWWVATCCENRSSDWPLICTSSVIRTSQSIYRWTAFGMFNGRWTMLATHCRNATQLR